jgi:hypothetical protein
LVSDDSGIVVTCSKIPKSLNLAKSPNHQITKSPNVFCHQTD